jgi:hypothetical protein
MKKQILLNNRKIELDEVTLENKKLLTALEYAHRSRERVRVFYGNPKTGKSWNEEHDIMGVVSNSTGDVACLILLQKITSRSGGALLDSCIVRIDLISEKRPLYQHENFHVDAKLDGLKVVTNEGNTLAVFDNEKRAVKYLKFLKGLSYAK